MPEARTFSKAAMRAAITARLTQDGKKRATSTGMTAPPLPDFGADVADDATLSAQEVSARLQAALAEYRNVPMLPPTEPLSTPPRTWSRDEYVLEVAKRVAERMPPAPPAPPPSNKTLHDRIAASLGRRIAQAADLFDADIGKSK
jgi:hypothetical protein